MRFSTITLGALLLLATAAPAMAQDETAPPPAFKVTGGVTLTSDYRFRGLTQTDQSPAIQATINVNHESGLYAGVWTSTIDGNSDSNTPALAGYGSAEVDLYGGFTKTFSNGVGVDVGLLYYLYPDRRTGLNTDFFEPYASLSYTIGPVSTKVGGAYSFGGQPGLDFTASNDDNIYVYAEAAVGIPKTPITLKGHIGYTDGSLGLINLVATDETYFDWSLTAEAAGAGPFKLGVSYIDTDVSNFGSFAQRRGRAGTAVGYITFSF